MQWRSRLNPAIAYRVSEGRLRRRRLAIPQRCTSAREGLQMNHRETAYAPLRATMGVIFLFYGVGKLTSGVGNFVGTMN